MYYHSHDIQKIFVVTEKSCMHFTTTVESEVVFGFRYDRVFFHQNEITKEIKVESLFCIN